MVCDSGGSERAPARSSTAAGPDEPRARGTTSDGKCVEVTNQDQTTPPVAGRRRWSRRSAGEASIKARLAWTVTIPWIVVAVLWVFACSAFAYDAIHTQQVASRFRQASLPAITALEQVQEERRLALESVGRAGASPELIAQQQRASAAVADMRQAAEAAASSAPTGVSGAIQRLNGYFDRMPEIRARIDAGTASVDEVVNFYNGLFDAATNVFEVQARTATETDTLQGALTGIALFRATDMMGRETTLGTAVLNEGVLSAEDHRKFAKLSDTYHAELENSVDQLEPEVRAQYEAMLASPEWQQLVTSEDEIITHGPHRAGEAPPVDPRAFGSAADKVTERMSGLVNRQADLISAEAVDNGNRTLQTVLWGSLAALLVALVSFLLSRRVYRSVVDNTLISRLKGLRTESLHLAQRLPEVVRKLREGGHVDVVAEMNALRGYGNDELGQVANAIQLFQKEAMDAAVGETRARQGARMVFVGMAHRIQRLLRHMHSTIDTLERNEENSAQLSRLFELDNAATRARRTVENLLVLGDQQPGRRWSKPVPLLDVLRSAVSEIDQYSRVVIGHVPDVVVTGAAVGDAIHLVSELIDNATAFSPPHTQVHVSADAVARGVAIEIADQGLGMDDRSRLRANRMMANPPAFDRLVLENNKAEQLGLFTAARLAKRRDVAVEFGVSAYGGTRATVLLPERLLSPRDTDQQALGGAPRVALAAGGAVGDPQPSDADTPPTGISVSQPPAAPTAVPAEPAPAETAPAEPVAAPAEPVPEAAGVAASGGRPPLPKRVPQSHLVDGLKEDPDKEADVVASPSRLAGFRRAFQGGSIADSGEHRDSDDHEQ